QTPEGLSSYGAELDGTRVVVHVGRRDPPHYDARARVAALRWLVEHRPVLFVPFVREVELGPDYSAFVRLDTAPQRLLDGARLPLEPALATAIVVHRALSWLHSVGRRFDDFSHSRIRVAGDETSFTC